MAKVRQQKSNKITTITQATRVSSELVLNFAKSADAYLTNWDTFST